MEDKSLKNIKIAETQRATYEKRRKQVCRVFQIKIQDNKLSRYQREQLKMLFVEGKWCYNAIVASPSVASMTQRRRLFSINTKMEMIS